MTLLAAWLARPARGWALLALCVALAGFYAAVLAAILSPRVDEAYRRTFMTAEFSVYPTSAVFAPDNGLAYAPGETLDLAGPRGRRHLARFDWRRGEPGAPRLRGAQGRVFLHQPPALRRPDLPHRLDLTLGCEASALRLQVLVNGLTVAETLCADGRPTISALLPPGLIGARDYEEIAIVRPDLGAAGRLALRLGLRFDAPALEAVTLTPAPSQGE